MDNKSNSKKLAAFVILGVVAVFSLARGIGTPPKSGRSVSSGSEYVAQGKAIEGNISAKRRAAISKYADWGRNPFILVKKASVTTTASPEIILEGIIWDKERPVALINGTIVKIGDKIKEGTVVDIKQNKIILNDGTKDFDLKLKQ